MTHSPPDLTALGGSHTNSSKAICPICYEDLKLTVEDLQAVSVCGHVFHELCLQQWLEYCPAQNKCTCPVCKQPCTSRDVTRLYFQSTGGAEADRPFNATQKTLSEAEVEALCGEIKKLQGKISAVVSTLDAQKRHVDELNGEILVWKEKAKKEEEMKNEHLKEKELVRHLLQIREADLSKVSEECARLQERNLALAKELAALKLAMDVNLGEEEIAKLAAIGNGPKHVDAVDVLQKSLFLRNKSYKELMAQCNLLGRAETRSLKKLEKAEEKIKKLRIRLQELEKALEKKDTEILRDMKAVRGKRDEMPDFNGFKQDLSSAHIGGYSSEVRPEDAIQESGDLNHISHALPEKSVQFASGSVLQDTAKIHKDGFLQTTYMSKTESFSSLLIETYQQSNLVSASSIPSKYNTKSGNSNMNKIVDENIPSMINPASAREATVVDDDFESPPLIPLTKYLVNDSNIYSGDPVLPSRPIVPESANKYTGKWCNRAHNKATPTMQTSTGSGNLIAVGADGRGGRIKVLRTHDKILDRKPQTQSLWPKKCKYGTTQGGEVQGSLRIEHFFGKIEN